MRFDSLAPWLQWQESLHNKSIDLGLERIRPVWQTLHNGPLPFKIVSIAGTNGKGSTVAYVESLCLVSGIHVGAYSSPHLLTYNERIRIDGKPVSDQVIMAAFQQVDDARAETPLTYFEFATFAALTVFLRHNLDVVVLEVGMGGRLDAVNIVDADIAVITAIDLDHQTWLGSDRETIGWEKAGIMREAKPVVCHGNPPRRVLQHARALSCPLWLDGKDYGYSQAQGQYWHWWINAQGQQQDLTMVLPSLAGEHQLANAAAACCVANLLARYHGMNIFGNNYDKALQQTRLAGRFQRLRTDLGREIIVDVAHNGQAACALAEVLKNNNKPVTAVFAALEDKDISAIIQPLLPVIDLWCVPRLYHDRGQNPAKIIAIIQQRSGRCAGPFKTVNDALHYALQQSPAQHCVLVFGSFYTVAEAITGLEKPSP